MCWGVIKQSFIHSFIYSFIHSFIHSFIVWVFSELCANEDVKTYPALKLFVKGEFLVDYKGELTKDALVKFIKNAPTHRDELWSYGAMFRIYIYILNLFIILSTFLSCLSLAFSPDVRVLSWCSCIFNEERKELFYLTIHSTHFNPLNYFSFQPVLNDWCNKGRGMCYPVCGMVHIKEPLLLIGNSSLCGGSGFPLSLSEWSFTIFLMPYNRK